MRQLTPPVEDYRVEHEPFYLASGDEVELFEHAWKSQLPVLLKGPTGCGKTRFVAYMAWAVITFVWGSWKFNEVAQGLIKVPIWIPQTSFVLGVLIFLVAVLDELVTVLRGEKPAYQLADEDRRARADFSETA